MTKYEKALEWAKLMRADQIKERQGNEDDLTAVYNTIIDALEKQIPQKIIERSKEILPGAFRHWEECPSCHTKMEYEWDGEPYCPHCGHAIDWSEVEE